MEAQSMKQSMQAGCAAFALLALANLGAASAAPMRGSMFKGGRQTAVIPGLSAAVVPLGRGLSALSAPALTGLAPGAAPGLALPARALPAQAAALPEAAQTGMAPRQTPAQIFAEKAVVEGAGAEAQAAAESLEAASAEGSVRFDAAEPKAAPAQDATPTSAAGTAADQAALLKPANAGGLTTAMKRAIAHYFSGLQDQIRKAEGTRERVMESVPAIPGKSMPSSDYVTEESIANAEEVYRSIKDVLIEAVAEFERFQKENADVIAIINTDKGLVEKHRRMVQAFQRPINFVSGYQLADYIPYDRAELNFWLRNHPDYINEELGGGRPAFERALRAMDSLEAIVARWEKQADGPDTIDGFYNALDEIRAITPYYGDTKGPYKYDYFARGRWAFQARLSKRFLDGLLKRPVVASLLEVDSRNVFERLFDARMLHIGYAAEALASMLESASTAGSAAKLKFPGENKRKPLLVRKQGFVDAWQYVLGAADMDKATARFLSFRPDIPKLLDWSIFQSLAAAKWTGYAGHSWEHPSLFAGSARELRLIKEYLAVPADRERFVELAIRHLIKPTAKKYGAKEHDSDVDFLKEQIRQIETIGPVSNWVKISKLGLFGWLEGLLGN